ncbi:uncharacterized protein LOC124664103 [Lolium rigidum]|uniref:uncharacterized protein LOC124664103 n=1 Tax=Lolium rigidum TaxID=89674 RepID=UPI001F5CB217|nr:uncharacterized protein LOC124664103 [Lolium rigidum]
MARRRSTGLRSQNHASEYGSGVARRRSPRLHPQIQPSEEGAGVTPRRSPRLHPQNRATEEGAGMARRIRRRRGTSPAEPATASLPDDDDMLREILTRLPPEPSSLPRASAVCRRWRGLVTDPKFHRQFLAHHRKPPHLGVILWFRNQGIVFNPILDPPDRIPPARVSLGRYSSRGGDCTLLDCRHGLLLISDWARHEVVVCDPIAGEQRCVAVPSGMRIGYLKGAVLCAAGDHGHVHGSRCFSSCKLVLLSGGRRDTPCLACVYTLETGLWGNLVSTEAPCYIFDGAPETLAVPATLVGDCLYWLVGCGILEFDFDKQNLAVSMGPPCPDSMIYGNHQIIQAADGVVGYAALSYPRLEMWQRNIDCHGIATWAPWKTVELDTILQLPYLHLGKGVQLLGYDGDDAVFLWHASSVYLVQLKPMQARKLNGISSPIMTRYHLFKSFFTPGTAIAGGFNAAELSHIG